MRVVIQRVSGSSVKVEEKVVGAISVGLMILVGFEEADTEDDIQWTSSKIINMRIFNDEAGVMNKSVVDVGGDLLVVSQFTLHASTRKGNRPSYIKAARPEFATPLYERFLKVISDVLGKPVQAGIFGADMKVSLINDGPVTIIVDSKQKE
jgi:D-aminoacyl-tRNA deacylase